MSSWFKVNIPDPVTPSSSPSDQEAQQRRQAAEYESIVAQKIGGRASTDIGGVRDARLLQQSRGAANQLKRLASRDMGAD